MNDKWSPDAAPWVS